MDSTSLERSKTSDSTNQGINGSCFKSCSHSKIPVARVKLSLKIAPEYQSPDFQEFINTDETNKDSDLNATPAPQDREPYQPLCEPITPEPWEKRPEPSFENKMQDYPIQIDERMKEFLDTMVILSQQYGTGNFRSGSPSEEPDYVS